MEQWSYRKPVVAVNDVLYTNEERERTADEISSSRTIAGTFDGLVTMRNLSGYIAKLKRC